MTKQTVLVLGAGFTKSFFPNMPLLVDRQVGQSLRELANALPAARAILDAEFRMTGGDAVDVERLMTRLDSGSPYDRAGRDQAELRVLLAELKKVFSDRILSSKASLDNDLIQLSTAIVRRRITCITFNYDDVLDEHLFYVSRETQKTDGSAYWDPQSGYGFASQDIEEFVDGGLSESPNLLLLKLHGSVNWRVRRGYTPPFPLNSLVRLAPWHPRGVERSDEELARLEALLEPEPLIVPPVLLKQELQTQPLFRLLWTQARGKLQNANELIFVGYSLPKTDLAARALFAESVDAATTISVVTRGSGPGRQRAAIEAYRQVWPRLASESFRFRDARSWARDFVKRSNSATSSG